MSNKFLILIIFPLSYQNTLSAFVGQNCTVESENGVCKLLKDCPRAIHELNYEKKLYTICSPLPDYIGIHPIVCCPLKTVMYEYIFPKSWENFTMSQKSI